MAPISMRGGVAKLIGARGFNNEDDQALSQDHGGRLSPSNVVLGPEFALSPISES
jgi:hypothetical protein